MKRYDSYKDSGVKWLGEIPSHWDSTSLLYMLREKISDGPHETPELKEEGIPFVSIDSLNETKNIDFSIVKKFISTKDYERYCLKTKLEEGDVLFSKAATIGKTAIVRDEIFMVWSPLAILKPNFDKITTLYLYYIMNCKKAIEEVSMSGSINTQINVGMRELEKVRIPIPSLKEQEAIASYLDTATSKIDEAIAQQQKMIDLLNERKQIIINNAVTKGLDPSVKMKPSGVDWIGDIPEYWEITKLKNVCQAFGRIGFRGYSTTDLVDEGEGCITLSPSNMSDGNMQYGKCTYLSWKKYEESPEIKIFNGDILFVKTGSTYGKSAIVQNLPLEATINPQLLVFKNLSCDNEFLAYVLQTNIIKTQVEFSVIGGTIPTISQQKILNYVIPTPPINEQKAIVHSIEKKCAPIYEAKKVSEFQISLLQERKQIIINDVVTGKVKVV